MKLILLIVAVLRCFYATYGINGGMKANKNEFKYLVSIAVTNYREPQQFGSLAAESSVAPRFYYGGGIIHNNFILTVAHPFVMPVKVNIAKKGPTYIFEKKLVLVYASTSNAYLPSPIQRRGKKVYFTTEFFETGLDDIAVLELNEDLDLNGVNNNILQKLIIPEIHRRTEVGEKCVIAGFGDDMKTLLSSDGSLKKMLTRILPSTFNCEHGKYLYGKAISKYYKYPKDSLGICRGDSGAPVVLLRSPLTIIGVAVTSASFRCDGRNESSPETYMKVASYLGLINHVTSLKADNLIYQSYNLI